MVIPDQDDETASPPPTAVSSLPGASEVPLPTVVEPPPAAVGPVDPVPDELPDGTEPAGERDQPTPAAKTDVRPKAAAETDVRPRAAARPTSAPGPLPRPTSVPQPSPPTPMGSATWNRRAGSPSRPPNQTG